MPTRVLIPDETRSLYEKRQIIDDEVNNLSCALS